MPLRTREFFTYWLPPLLLVGVILFLSGNLGSAQHTLRMVTWLLGWITSLTPAQCELVNFFLRKTAHAVVYGLQYFLWFRAFRGHLRAPQWKSCLWSLGLCLLLALVDEGHQMFFKSRTGSIFDVYLDLGGATLGALITIAFWTPRPRMTSS
jgi:VanZ family protein